jgi:hypothetical protein
METIGDLLDFLRCFDPSLRLHILAVEGAGRSELVAMSAMEVVGRVVSRTAGVPSSVWLVGQSRDAEALDPPLAIGIERPACRCLVEIPVVLDRPIATWRIECEHSMNVSSQ